MRRSMALEASYREHGRRVVRAEDPPAVPGGVVGVLGKRLGQSRFFAITPLTDHAF